MPARQAQHPILRTAVLALALAVAACDGTDGPAGPAGPDGAEPLDPRSAPQAPDLLTAGTGPRILFMSSRTGGTDVYRMNPQGTGVVRVTSFSGPEYSPTWSWDNKRIAMERLRVYAPNVSNRDIFVMNADGTGKRWVRPAASSYAITSPSWSHDGTRLVVTLWNAGIPRLALMNAATGDLQLVSELLGGPVGTDPAFDPTGKKIVYAGQGALTLEMINADGSGHKVLMTAPAGSWIGDPAFSADGKRVAVTKRLNGNADIYVKNLVDGTVKRLTTNAGFDFSPTWSADGSQIAFSSDRSGQYQVWIVSSTGGTQVRLTKTSTAETRPAWSH